MQKPIVLVFLALVCLTSAYQPFNKNIKNEYINLAASALSKNPGPDSNYYAISILNKLGSIGADKDTVLKFFIFSTAIIL